MASAVAAKARSSPQASSSVRRSATPASWPSASGVHAIAGARAWWAPILDEHGRPLTAKVEGLVRFGGRWLASIDADDPARPSDLLELTPPA